MLLDFPEMGEIVGPGMNGGTGTMRSRMHADRWGKAILCSIEPGGSIGPHVQATSVDVNYVASGYGMATCDGVEEPLRPGVCHICPQGSTHSITNTGDEDLVLFTVVAERPSDEA